MQLEKSPDSSNDSKNSPVCFTWLLSLLFVILMSKSFNYLYVSYIVSY